jgi:hypothetical protein
LLLGSGSGFLSQALEEPIFHHAVGFPALLTTAATQDTTTAASLRKALSGHGASAPAKIKADRVKTNTAPDHEISA